MTITRTPCHLALLLLALLTACNLGREKEKKAQPAGPPQIVFGLLAPLSGPLSEFGQSLLRGATLAVELENAAGGPLQRKIKLEVADTAAGENPDCGAIAREFAKKTSPTLIFGAIERQCGADVAILAAELQLPFIALGNTSLQTCTREQPPKVSPFVWHLGATEVMSVEPFLVYLSDKMTRPDTPLRLSYFGTDEIESRLIADYIIEHSESLGFETAKEMYPDSRISDYYQILRELLNYKADVLFVTAQQSVLDRFLSQGDKLTLKKDFLLAGFNTIAEENVLSLNQYLQGAETATTYLQEIDSPENKEFLRHWTKKFPGVRPTAHAVTGGYSVVKLAAQALRRANSPEARKFLAALSLAEMRLPQGQVLASPANHTFILPLYAVKVQGPSYKLLAYLGDVAHPNLERCAENLQKRDSTKKDRTKTAEELGIPSELLK